MRAKKLRVGDRIRFVSWPNLNIPGRPVHSDTLRVYDKLIAKKAKLRVYKIDKQGFWVRFLLRMDGVMKHHDLCVFPHDDNWERVDEDEEQ